MEERIEIVDEYEHEEEHVEYILENVLMSDDSTPEFCALQEEYNYQLALACKCLNNSNCNDKDSCCHSAGFKYNHQSGEFILNQDRAFSGVIECNELCKCRINQCKNRRVQFGPRKGLEVFESPLYKSKGLRTKVDIPCGAFICEYAGELLTLPEARRRLELIDKNGLMNYILCLNEHSVGSKLLATTIVDPSHRGNIGRYLNHSCQPNCEILAVRANSPIPKIAIFAKRNINANEELCFHYAGESHQENLYIRKPCLCAATDCNGIIPNTKI